MAPSHLRTVEASSVEYTPAVAADGESVYDAPPGTHQVMEAQADTHYTNPQDCGFGYASSIIWRLYEQNGEVPTMRELLEHVYGMEVPYKGRTYEGYDLMAELAEHFAERLIRQAVWILEQDDLWDVCFTFMEGQMFRQTLKAMDYEIPAVVAYAEEHGADEIAATHSDMLDAVGKGESSGIDAAVKVDGEWVTLQVKPKGEPDKGNADVLLTYETAASGKVNIRQHDRR